MKNIEIIFSLMEETNKALNAVSARGQSELIYEYATFILLFLWSNRFCTNENALIGKKNGIIFRLSKTMILQTSIHYKCTYMMEPS